VYLCTVLYHPPQKEDVRFVEFFNNFLDRVSTFNGINLILGDFNFDILKHSFYGEKILDSVYSNSFVQIVESPSRITDRSQTLIDYIITNNKLLQHKVHLTPKVSSHCVLSLSLFQKRVKKSTITCYEQ